MIADILKMMEGAGKAEGAFKLPTNTEAEAMLDGEGKSSLEKLKGSCCVSAWNIDPSGGVIGVQF